MVHSSSRAELPQHLLESVLCIRTGFHPITHKLGLLYAKIASLRMREWHIDHNICIFARCGTSWLSPCLKGCVTCSCTAYLKQVRVNIYQLLSVTSVSPSSLKPLFPFPRFNGHDCQEKRTFLASVPQHFLPLIRSGQSWCPNLRRDREVQEGTLRRPQRSHLSGEQFGPSHNRSVPVTQRGGQGTNGFCHNRCIVQHQEGQKVPLCIAIHEATEGTRAESEMQGEKKTSDPSRYLNNVSWLKWNALVRPSGGEFDIFCVTCKIKRKCCWLLHCLLKGTGADRNVIKLPAAFICCHSSPCNEYNNNFVYSLA